MPKVIEELKLFLTNLSKGSNTVDTSDLLNSGVADESVILNIKEKLGDCPWNIQKLIDLGIGIIEKKEKKGNCEENYESEYGKENELEHEHYSSDDLISEVEKISICGSDMEYQKKSTAKEEIKYINESSREYGESIDENFKFISYEHAEEMLKFMIQENYINIHPIAKEFILLITFVFNCIRKECCKSSSLNFEQNTMSNKKNIKIHNNDEQENNVRKNMNKKKNIIKFMNTLGKQNHIFLKKKKKSPEKNKNKNKNKINTVNNRNYGNAHLKEDVMSKNSNYNGNESSTNFMQYIYNDSRNNNYQSELSKLNTFTSFNSEAQPQETDSVNKGIFDINVTSHIDNINKGNNYERASSNDNNYDNNKWKHNKCLTDGTFLSLLESEECEYNVDDIEHAFSQENMNKVCAIFYKHLNKVRKMNNDELAKKNINIIMILFYLTNRYFGIYFLKTINMYVELYYINKQFNEYKNKNENIKNNLSKKIDKYLEQLKISEQHVEEFESFKLNYTELKKENEKLKNGNNIIQKLKKKINTIDNEKLMIIKENEKLEFIIKKKNMLIENNKIIEKERKDEINKTNNKKTKLVLKKHFPLSSKNISNISVPIITTNNYNINNINKHSELVNKNVEHGKMYNKIIGEEILKKIFDKTNQKDIIKKEKGTQTVSTSIICKDELSNYQNSKSTQEQYVSTSNKKKKNYDVCILCENKQNYKILQQNNEQLEIHNFEKTEKSGTISTISYAEKSEISSNKYVETLEISKKFMKVPNYKSILNYQTGNYCFHFLLFCKKNKNKNKILIKKDFKKYIICLNSSNMGIQDNSCYSIIGINRKLLIENIFYFVANNISIFGEFLFNPDLIHACLRYFSNNFADNNNSGNFNIRHNLIDDEINNYVLPFINYFLNIYTCVYKIKYNIYCSYKEYPHCSDPNHIVNLFNSYYFSNKYFIKQESSKYAFFLETDLSETSNVNKITENVEWEYYNTLSIIVFNAIKKKGCIMLSNYILKREIKVKGDEENNNNNSNNNKPNNLKRCNNNLLFDINNFTINLIKHEQHSWGCYKNRYLQKKTHIYNEIDKICKIWMNDNENENINLINQFNYELSSKENGICYQPPNNNIFMPKFAFLKPKKYSIKCKNTKKYTQNLKMDRKDMSKIDKQSDKLFKVNSNKYIPNLQFSNFYINTNGQTTFKVSSFNCLCRFFNFFNKNNNIYLKKNQKIAHKNVKNIMSGNNKSVKKKKNSDKGINTNCSNYLLLSNFLQLVSLFVSFVFIFLLDIYILNNSIFSFFTYLVFFFAFIITSLLRSILYIISIPLYSKIDIQDSLDYFSVAFIQIVNYAHAFLYQNEDLIEYI
ncbi:conserved Plasmodium protein, unknown function [Plasmodium berghei]|uniref:Uncharacterized protein n=2 Tax=Plasmodium berghei TaxID=5821 RepID=A0A509AKY3_PLABA|nr:conserved Plasmodium protein, unknown function [Plasmodium berghei ANKA]CXI52645.1 conserved Plasmodium protein, unknown function [Plasmodium berghei]SCL94667.1 conserved Plasmodium protein, unknown function [Plasmodium berghei]SCM16075.1 conserved Plasmodium protein, unknown function [Plasmodium berghei]SCM17870.1 conserved Plasmodium protein, unknown function [Plasmodium berghei]SCN26181.1 conserved Plasmodium protein, unknown function [Plasmodium berghei]|eukprot:XP_034421999.1 conserved Plasmodium protein, unknown function [Plasmodium berghei ANKA]